MMTEALPLKNPQEQGEVPFALVQGKPWSDMPKDLYIPPDALDVFLDAFEGPLDLLLYLIRRQNLDILDIPILDITTQYMEYVELMQDFQLELASEYLVMAAMLAEIKSSLLLPQRPHQEEDESDPRAELIRRLQTYECYKQAALNLDELPRLDRDVFLPELDVAELGLKKEQPEVALPALLFALSEVMQRQNWLSQHQVTVEVLSVREQMSHILDRLSPHVPIEMSQLFQPKDGRLGIVVTFLAILELLKLELILMVQSEVFAEIHLRAVTE